MRFIPTRTHGVLDYLVGALLMVSPWLFDFAAGGAETWLPVVLGAATIIYSVFTDYELGLVRKIPMPVHLALDLLSGALLAVSPWLFAFSKSVWAPHLIIGLFEIGASLFTRTAPAVAHGTTRRGVTKLDLH
ncbi:MAG TPA: SPW repeat protein [Gemmatimonadales bacterium]|nr:SPW repeat protein [Gemmatimonadales bacterium]